MTKLLDRAVELARSLPAADQDDIARIVLQLAGDQNQDTIPLSPAERDAIESSKLASARGDFATDEQVRAVWSKHGL